MLASRTVTLAALLTASLGARGLPACRAGGAAPGPAGASAPAQPSASGGAATGSTGAGAASPGAASPGSASTASAGTAAGSPDIVPRASALNWQSCGGQLGGLRCASLQVPLNYADP